MTENGKIHVYIRCLKTNLLSWQSYLNQNNVLLLLTE